MATKQTDASNHRLVPLYFTDTDVAGPKTTIAPTKRRDVIKVRANVQVPGDS